MLVAAVLLGHADHGCPRCFVPCEWWGLTRSTHIHTTLVTFYFLPFPPSLPSFFSFLYGVAHSPFACYRWGLPCWLAQCATPGMGLVWLIGAMVCLLAAPWVQLSISAGNGWPHNALRHHWLMLISCHSRDCKALLVTSLTHVSGAINAGAG